MAQQLTEWDYVYRSKKKGGGKWQEYFYHTRENCKRLHIHGASIKKVRLGAALAAGYKQHACF